MLSFVRLHKILLSPCFACGLFYFILFFSLLQLHIQHAGALWLLMYFGFFLQLNLHLITRKCMWSEVICQASLQVCSFIFIGAMIWTHCGWQTIPYGGEIIQCSVTFVLVLCLSSLVLPICFSCTLWMRLCIMTQLSCLLFVSSLRNISTLKNKG